MWSSKDGASPSALRKSQPCHSAKASLDERERALVEALHVEARRRAAVPAQPVDPCVVGAPDPSLVPCLTDLSSSWPRWRQMLWNAADHMVVTPDQQEALGPDLDESHLVAR